MSNSKVVFPRVQIQSHLVWTAPGSLDVEATSERLQAWVNANKVALEATYEEAKLAFNPEQESIAKRACFNLYKRNQNAPVASGILIGFILSGLNKATPVAFEDEGDQLEYETKLRTSVEAWIDENKGNEDADEKFFISTRGKGGGFRVRDFAGLKSANQ